MAPIKIHTLTIECLIRLLIFCYRTVYAYYTMEITTCQVFLEFFL